MHIVLGSQSPRRRELVLGLVNESSLTVIPPDDNEDGFDDVCTQAEIENRLKSVVATKMDDVVRKCESRPGLPDYRVIICADTVVVVHAEDGRLKVLGKPPVPDWQDTVRSWFKQYYIGKPHEVWTCCRMSGVISREFIVRTEVRMADLDDSAIDWYLSTGESPGKAGGYGIQGHAAAFIQSVSGSLTNVIGFPILEVGNELRSAGWKSSQV